MISGSVDMLDCCVKVREYQLIPQPSRWGLKNESGVLVQSPILEISDKVSHLPAKRHSHVEEINSVTFLPKEDIADDTNGRRTVSTCAHGVALCNSDASDDLEYKRGDTLWICIGSKTHDYDLSVPVVNLQTFKQGTIGIDKVCWCPKIQGPDGELWTLGGETRKLKHHGSRKFSYWSWVICQRLDGGKPTTKSVEIPIRDVELPNRRLLSASESKFFYEKRYRATEQASRSNSVALLSPPLTPPQVFESPAKKAKHAPEPSQSPPLKTTDVEVWRRIMAVAKRSKEGYKPLQLGAAHTGKHVLTQQEDQETTDDSSSDSEAAEVESRPSSSPSPYNSSSNSSTHKSTSLDREQPRIAIFNETSSRHIIAALRSQGIANRKARPFGNNIAMSGRHDDVEHDILSNPDLLCDLKDPNCKEITTSRCYHYHSPPSKCVLDDAPPGTGPHPPHEHCISRLRALPDKAGPCILADIPSRKHVCCYWEEKDRASWAAPLREDYARSKEEKSRVMRERILYDCVDLSRWVNYQPGWRLA